MKFNFTIPEKIVVHLGSPDDPTARNVTVPFTDYIKNVASSEIYPTWPENAIRANIYAQISFALNRIFTEYYRARGYNFDITNSTQYDQSFVYERNVFDNISRIVDDIFNSYIVRSGDITPLYARYCNGTTSTCPGGMSQWGSVSLANQGYTPFRILTSYYGDISLVENAPVANVPESYPGTPLRVGDSGLDVKLLQIALNRISKNYPAIPKIAYPDGFFDPVTESAVKEFQNIFNLTQDGVVGRATWYKIASVIAGIKRLSELDPERIPSELVSGQFKEVLEEGDSGTGVIALQYFLTFIAEFNDFIPQVAIDGSFGPQTTNAVKQFQRSVGLPETGIVDKTTWDSLYSSFLTKYNSLPAEYRTSATAPYPGEPLTIGSSGESVTTLQRYLQLIGRTFPEIPEVEITGTFDIQTLNAVNAYAREFGLPERGDVNYVLWNSISNLYSDLLQGEEKSFGQHPGYPLSENSGTQNA